MSIIVVGGTPGTGKTEVARELGSILSKRVVSLGELAREAGCITEYDEERDSGVIDEDCLVEAIMDLLDTYKDEDLIIEGHYVDLVPASKVRMAFILRTHPETLRERLREREYPQAKIRENVEAEVVGVCQMDAIEVFGEELVVEVDTTGLSPKDVARNILQSLESPTAPRRIDWMEMLEKEGRLDDFLEPM